MEWWSDPKKNKVQILSGALDSCHIRFGSWLESFASLKHELARQETVPQGLEQQAWEGL